MLSKIDQAGDEPTLVVCKLKRWRNTLDAEDNKILDRWFADRDLSAQRIVDRLLRAGYATTDTTVRNHRTGRCRTCH